MGFQLLRSSDVLRIKINESISPSLHDYLCFWICVNGHPRAALMNISFYFQFLSMFPLVFSTPLLLPFRRPVVVAGSLANTSVLDNIDVQPQCTSASTWGDPHKLDLQFHRSCRVASDMFRARVTSFGNVPYYFAPASATGDYAFGAQRTPQRYTFRKRQTIEMDEMCRPQLMQNPTVGRRLHHSRRQPQ